jgi:hypothetical protein
VRSLHAAVTALKNSGHCETHSALDLAVLSGGMTTTYRFATALLTVNGNSYLPNLRQTGALKMSLTRSADRVEVAVQNVDKAMGLALEAAPDALLSAAATVGRVYRDTSSGAAYYATLLPGVVVAAKTTELEVRLSIVSDIAAATQIAGWRKIGRACNWRKFKGVECGYAGALTTCNRLYDHADGCSGRSQQHRFGGFIFITPKADENTTVITDPNDTPYDPGGGGYGGGYGGGSGRWDEPYMIGL